MTPEEAWREAAIRLEREAAARDAHARAAERAHVERQQRAERLEQRRGELLGELRRRGNPGLSPRRVLGGYHLSIADKIFGRPGNDMEVEAEPAWPIGTFTWCYPASHGTRRFENLATGYTPADRIVPMEFATRGDDVDKPWYAARKLARKFDQTEARSFLVVRVPSNEDIVKALEIALSEATPPAPNSA